MVLKPPIVDKCHDTGLHGCEDLADGVIDYATGDRQEGTNKLKKGMAANAPDQLQEFAAKVRMLKDIPGAAQYAGPLLEVADLIASSAGSSPGTSASPATYGSIESKGSQPGSSSGSSRAPAPSDSVVPAADGGEACKLFGDATYAAEPGQAVSLEIGKGPLIVTDMQTNPACPNGLALIAGSLTSPLWLLYTEPSTSISVHGAAYAVPTSVKLFAIQVTPPGQDPVKDVRCAITWAARVP